MDVDPKVYLAVSICEGEYNDTHEFRSVEELVGFMDGFTTGANCYGAGAAGVYDLDDLEENGGDIGPDDKYYAIIKEHLE